MHIPLGSIAPATTGTLLGEINLEDGGGNPANQSGAALAVYALGDSSPQANASATLSTPIGGIAGLYLLTVTITGGGLAAGNYSVRFTAGSVGSPAMSLVGVVAATFAATIDQLAEANAKLLAIETAFGTLGYPAQTITLTPNQTIVGGTWAVTGPSGTFSNASLAQAIASSLNISVSKVAITGSGPYYVAVDESAGITGHVTGVNTSGLTYTLPTTWANPSNDTLTWLITLPAVPVSGQSNLNFRHTGGSATKISIDYQGNITYPSGSANVVSLTGSWATGYTVVFSLVGGLGIVSVDREIADSPLDAPVLACTATASVSAPQALLPGVRLTAAELQDHLNPATLAGQTLQATAASQANQATYTQVEALPAGLGAVIDTQLSNTHGPGAWGSNLLVNGRALAITVQTTAAVAIAGVQVVLTSDAAGNNVVSGTFTTNSSGIASFTATPGTYYVWRNKGNYAWGTNPRTLVVVAGSGTQTATYADGTGLTGTIPAAADVRLGTAVGSTTGTLDLPLANNVAYGVMFDGNTQQGTYTNDGYVLYSSAVSLDGTTFQIIQGDAYDLSESAPVSWTDPGWWPNLATATHIYFTTRNSATDAQDLTIECTVVAATSTTGQKVIAKPTHANTAAMTIGDHKFDLQAMFADHDNGPLTLVWGTGVVIQPVRRV